MVLALCAPARAAAGGALADLRQELLSGRSATAILQQRCSDLRLADPPVVRAWRDPNAAKEPPADVRRALQAGRRTTLVYRRVRLVCGPVVLSTADNWYRPDRLTAPMNATLQTTDAPFGRVVAPLDFHRRTLWIRQRPGSGGVLQLEAVLVDGRERPFAVVREAYRSSVVAPEGSASRPSAAATPRVVAGG